MNNREFAEMLEQRTKKIAIEIIRFMRILPDNLESKTSETFYWLEIIKAIFDVDENRFDMIYKESDELLALFTSISKGKNS